MLKKLSLLAIFAVLGLAFALPASAAPGQPDFAPHVYADGDVFGTKFTTELRAPNEHNAQSFDSLFVVTNGAGGQLPVSEAGPGNPAYNGGRWAVKTATWTPEGMAAHGGSVPLLTSYEDVMFHYDLGHLDITDGHPAGGPDYFQCPLLPVK